MTLLLDLSSLPKYNCSDLYPRADLDLSRASFIAWRLAFLRLASQGTVLPRLPLPHLRLPFRFHMLSDAQRLFIRCIAVVQFAQLSGHLL